MLNVYSKKKWDTDICGRSVSRSFSPTSELHMHQTSDDHQSSSIINNNVYCNKIKKIKKIKRLLDEFFYSCILFLWELRILQWSWTEVKRHACYDDRPSMHFVAAWGVGVPALLGKAQSTLISSHSLSVWRRVKHKFALKAKHQLMNDSIEAPAHSLSRRSISHTVGEAPAIHFLMQNCTSAGEGMGLSCHLILYSEQLNVGPCDGWWT
jgi:hypothetical protein